MVAVAHRGLTFCYLVRLNMHAEKIQHTGVPLPICCIRIFPGCPESLRQFVHSTKLVIA